VHEQPNVTARRDGAQATDRNSVTELLSDASIERFKANLIRRLRRPAVDAARVKKLEGEIANIVDTIAQGIRSSAPLSRLHVAQAELERLRAAAKVTDIEAILAALPVAVARYRELVESMGSKSPIDVDATSRRRMDIRHRRGSGGPRVALFADTVTPGKNGFRTIPRARLEPVVWTATKATRQRSIEFRQMSNGNCSSLRPARQFARFAPIARPNERTHEVNTSLSS
jgi:hypothetical protein